MKHTKVRTSSALVVAAWSMFFLVTGAASCPAHVQRLHKQISKSAALSSDGLKAFLVDCLGDTDAPFTNGPRLPLNGFPGTASASQSPIEWIRAGSHDEDEDPNPLLIAIRSGDHYYTVAPVRVAGLVPGLTDGSETLVLPYKGIINSFRWATVPDVTGPWFLCPPGQQNIYGWSNARDYQLRALTYPSPDDRKKYLAAMLCALGHVMHLNQDLSQPEHVRNDEHVLHRAIENYGSGYVADAERDSTTLQQRFPQVPRGWTYWQGQGFQKILDFWDRGMYKGGDPVPLDRDADATVGRKLGLAEFSNGNFLGEDATYGEFFTNGGPHYFPLPSLKNTTQTQLRSGHFPSIAIDSITLENGKPGKRIYVRKLGAGAAKGLEPRRVASSRCLVRSALAGPKRPPLPAPALSALAAWQRRSVANAGPDCDGPWEGGDASAI